jgi:hypothetical protein
MATNDKRYRVIRSGPVLDHAPGETFVATLPEDQEAFLLQIGALEIVPGPKPKDEVKDAKRR